MLYAIQEPATGPLTEADLDAAIEPWHLAHAIRQQEEERRQHDAAAQPTDGAHPVTEVGADDDKRSAGEGAGPFLWPLAVLLAVACTSFLAWALKR